MAAINSFTPVVMADIHVAAVIVMTSIHASAAVVMTAIHYYTAFVAATDGLLLISNDLPGVGLLVVPGAVLCFLIM